VIRIATLNLRNTADGWRRRRDLLVAQFVDLDVDVIGLQEVRILPDQAAWITRRAQRWAPAGPDRVYRRHRAPKTGLAGLREGIGVLSRLPVVDRGWLDLGAEHRVALRVTVRLPGGPLLEVYDVHLAAAVDESVHAEQAGRVLAWMATRPSPFQVLLGDFNSRPDSPAIALVAGGMRSAFRVVHGCEPPRTVPTPLRRTPEHPGSVIDYIFVSEALVVHDARVVFDRLDPADPFLAASDHYGLVTTVSAGPGPLS